MNLRMMKRRHSHVTNEDSYPKIISFNDDTCYSRVSSSNDSVRITNNRNYYGIIIDLGEDVQIDSIEFSCGIQTYTARFMAYNSLGANQMQHIYSPCPRSVSSNFSIKTIYFSVNKDTKENAYILDRTHNQYIFNGSTFDWSKYLE